MTSRYHTTIYLLISILFALLLSSCEKPKVERTYTVTFSSEGGSAVPVQTVKENGKAVNPAAPTREGHAFRGWYRDKGFQQPFDFAKIPITAAITLYAKWDLIMYTVTFKSEGDSNLELQRVVKGQMAVKPVQPIREGYAFMGWYEDNDFKRPFDFAKTPITVDITLYAKWNRIYTVTFSSEGGTDVSPKSVDIESGKTVSEPPSPPTRANYVFAGWHRDKTVQNPFVFDSAITAAITLYAKWNPIQYTVTFSSEGGTDVSPKSVDIESGKTVSEPPSPPTRANYVFAGWHRDKTVQNPFVFDSAITAAITLYAKWNLIQYTVTFSSEGGTDVSPKSVDVENGKTVSEPPSPPTRANYVFAGWYRDKTVQDLFAFNSPIRADITLYAKWNPIQYTVTFESNGGIPAPPAQPVAYGEKVNIPPVSTREGYVFGGWYSTSGFQRSFNFDTATVRGSITLYAKWNRAMYTVTFERNEGTPVLPQTVTYGEKLPRPNDPTRTGYTFVDWYEDNGFQRSFDFANTTITAAITLYAKWNPIQYTVTFESNGGIPVPSSQTVAYGEKVNLPPVPTRTGYVFGGWYSTINFQGSFSFDTATVRGSFTLYAKWGEAATVTFDSRGGSVVAAKVVAKGSRISAPTPTNGKLTLLAWYTTPNFAEGFDFSRAINSNITLYAKYGFRVPDDNFRKRLKFLISSAFSSINSEVMDVSHTTVTGLDSLDVTGQRITSLVGIEYFTSLTKLWCPVNQMSSLDVSQNTQLEFLHCNRNQLTSLNVSANTSLKILVCSFNQLTSLDVSGNTSLTKLSCDENRLTSLDVSANASLKTLWCPSNQLTSLDVSGNTSLMGLMCANNTLVSLNMSGATALGTLWCNNNKLTQLNLATNTGLDALYCQGNSLTSLDIRGVASLIYLTMGAGEGGKNPLTSLRVLDGLKDHAEIKEAKTNRGAAVTITTYNTDRTQVTCNNYDPNRAKCLDP